MEIQGNRGTGHRSSLRPRRRHRQAFRRRRRHRLRAGPGAVHRARRRHVPDGVTLIPTDVTSGDEVQAAVEQIVESGLPLRTVVNCAGVGWAGRILSKNGPHDLELFRTVITVNLLGTFNVMRLAADAIAQDRHRRRVGQRGVVINTASVAAFEGQIGQIAYSASKGGVRA